MGAFGIYAAILTFALVVYYAVMVSMDLFGDKKQKKDEVEVITNTSSSEEEIVDEQPIYVDEGDAPGSESDSEFEYDKDQVPLTESEIENQAINELYESAKTAKEEALDVEIHSKADYNAMETVDKLKELMQEQEAYSTELS